MTEIAESDRVRIMPRHSRMGDVIRGYVDKPEIFQLQFGRDVSQVEHVIAHHETLAQAGVQSFYSAERRIGSEWHEFAHLRVEWRLTWAGIRGLHGGNDNPHPDLGEFRKDAFGLLVLATLADRTCDSLATSVLVENVRARKFISKFGFRKMRTERGPHAVAHYRAVREWVNLAPLVREIAKRSIVNPLQPVVYTPETAFEASVWQTSMPDIPAPAGWKRLAPSMSERFFDTLLKIPNGWRHVLDQSTAELVSSRQLVQGLALDCAHGIIAWCSETDGHPTGLLLARGSCTNGGRISLRGGPFPGSNAPSVGEWIKFMLARGVARIEGVFSERSMIPWWERSGFTYEGIGEVDRVGHEISFVASVGQ